MAYNPLRIFRRDADTTISAADGAQTNLTVNSLGRLKVSAIPGSIDPVTGNLGAVGNTVVAEVARASNVMITITGTFAGVNATFEGSIDGGTTWIALQAVRSNANTIELTTGVLGSAPAYGWELSVNAMTHVRLRATAWTSGTAVVRILPGSYATEPIPAMQTHAVSLAANQIVGQNPTTSATGLTQLMNGALSNTPILVKTGNTRLYQFDFYNPNVDGVWVQLFNIAAAASVTMGTTTPTRSIYIPGESGRDFDSNFSANWNLGLVMAVATTRTGGTAPAAAIQAYLGYV